MSEEFKAAMDDDESITVVGADAISSGLVVHFSNETTSLFTPRFLYAARAGHGNTLLIEQGSAVPGSPIAKALEDGD